MKKIIFFIAIAIAVNTSAQVSNNLSKQKVKLTPAAAYIFKDVKTRLTNEEKNFFADGYTIKYYDGTPQLNIIEDIDVKTHDTDCIYASVIVFPTDLNNDGIEEIFIYEEDAWIKYQESHPAFYIKNKVHKYAEQESLDETGPNNIYIGSSYNLGYPDLRCGDQYYRWNGEKYIPNKHTNSIKSKTADKSLVQISNAYTSSLPDSLLKNDISFDEPETSSSSKVSPVSETAYSSNATPPESREKPKIGKTVTLSPVAESLFTNVKTKLTTAQKNEIAYLTGIKPEELNDKTKKGKPKYELNIYPVDFDNNGYEEIFLCVTTKLLGITNRNYFFYATDYYGRYQPSPGKIGNGAKILLNGKTGFPDLITGTPGLERDVWTWHGHAYDLVQKIPGTTAIPYQTKNIDEASKEYTK